MRLGVKFALICQAACMVPAEVADGRREPQLILSPQLTSCAVVHVHTLTPDEKHTLVGARSSVP